MKTAANTSQQYVSELRISRHSEASRIACGPSNFLNALTPRPAEYARQHNDSHSLTGEQNRPGGDAKIVARHFSGGVCVFLTSPSREGRPSFVSQRPISLICNDTSFWPLFECSSSINCWPTSTNPRFWWNRNETGFGGSM
jgi:hypothetical protein